MPNTLTEVIPQILAQGMMALRQNAIMPHLVNTMYMEEAKQKGSTVDIPIPSAITATQVTAANHSPDGDYPISPTSVAVALDQWWEAPFYLTDQDIVNAMNGVVPMQASEAIKALANNVDQYLLNLYKGVYNFVGTPGVTPFAADTTDVTGCRVKLNTTLAPLGDRRMVIDPNAEGNALNLRAFQDFSFSGDASAIINGDINRKLGFDWFMDQNVQRHTAGTITTGLATTGTSNDLGSKTLHAITAASTGACDLKAGDILTLAGYNQTFVVTAAVAQAVANTTVDIAIEPGLPAEIASGTAISVKGNHTVNMAFHRDAFAFASRPLVDTVEGMGNLIMATGDPISGLSLRLEVSREHKRTRFSFDILYGAALVRRELACRLAG